MCDFLVDNRHERVKTTKQKIKKVLQQKFCFTSNINVGVKYFIVDVWF